MHCSHCGQYDHNTTTYTTKKAGQLAVKKIKRPTTTATTADPHQQPGYGEENFQVCAQPQQYILHVQI
jgi:uncharacterized Zn finger protein